MKRLQREVQCRKLFAAVVAVAVLVMAHLAQVLANHVLLPRYFQYSLASREHLRKVNEQGKANIYVVGASGEERKVGELESRVKTRYSTASVLLEASLVLPTVLALFLGWPRARDGR